MNKQNTCCNLCYGRMGTTAGGGIYCNNSSCPCHTSQESAKSQCCDSSIKTGKKGYYCAACGWAVSVTGIILESAKNDKEVDLMIEMYNFLAKQDNNGREYLDKWLHQGISRLLATQRERYKDEALKQYGMGQQEGIKYARESMRDNGDQ